MSRPGVIPCSPADGITPAVVRIAASRTRPLLLNWHLMDHDIRRLLVSAYLQGCRDTAEAVARDTSSLT